MSELITKIYSICDEKYEPERYKKMKDLEKTIKMPIHFSCATWKTEISNEFAKLFSNSLTDIDKHPSSNDNVKKAVTSLFYNYKYILEEIKRDYKDGIFLILESDVIMIEKWDKCLEAINALNKNKDKWHACYLGYNGSKDDILKSEGNIITDKNQEDFTNNYDTNRFIRKWYTKAADSILWTYDGILEMLNHMQNIDKDFSEPFDLYLVRLLLRSHFKYYWSYKPYFIQTSLYCNDKSSISV